MASTNIESLKQRDHFEHLKPANGEPLRGPYSLVLLLWRWVTWFGQVCITFILFKLTNDSLIPDRLPYPARMAQWWSSLPTLVKSYSIQFESWFRRKYRYIVYTYRPVNLCIHQLSRNCHQTQKSLIINKQALMSPKSFLHHFFISKTLQEHSNIKMNVQRLGSFICKLQHDFFNLWQKKITKLHFIVIKELSIK